MQLKETNWFKILAIINTIIIVLIYVDFYFPVESKVIEKFDSFESGAVIIRSSFKSGSSNSYGINNYINCKSGNSYFLTKTPEFQSMFESNKNFTLTKTYFFGKIKKIGIEKNHIFYEENSSFLNYSLNKSLYLLVLIISIATIYYPTRVPSILLAFATAYIFMITPCYLF